MTAIRATTIAFVCLALQATPRTVTLQGRAVRLGTTNGVAHVRVVVAKIGGVLEDYHTMVADTGGQFVFRDLTAGSYRVYASHDGYLQSEYGRHAASPSGLPVAIGEGQTAAEVVISMTPTGAIAGRVLDRGRLLRGAIVRALKPAYYDGRRSLSTADWAETDDRGEYRLFGLAPGHYIVSAVPRPQPRIEGDTLAVPAIASVLNNNQQVIRSPLTLDTLPPAAFDTAVSAAVYHPGTIDPAMALPVELRAGDTVSGIDLTIVSTSTFHVRGRVSLQGTWPVPPQVQVGAIPVEAGTPVRLPSVDARDGAFDLPNVAPGRYTVFARALVQGNTSSGTAAAVDVVDRDLDGVALTLETGLTVTGRVTVDGGSPPAGPLMLVQLLAPPGLVGSSAVRCAPDGSFAIQNVFPGDYRFRVLQAGRTPWVKAARFGQDDVLTTPIRVGADPPGRQLSIDLGTNTATLAVLVVDYTQRPVAGALVVAVPEPARRDRSDAYRTAATGVDGRASIPGIAPGDYLVFASEDIDANAWQDPSVLRLYEGRGSAVRLREGATQTITVRPTP